MKLFGRDKKAFHWSLTTKIVLVLPTKCTRYFNKTRLTDLKNLFDLIFCGYFNKIGLIDSIKCLKQPKFVWDNTKFL